MYVISEKDRQDEVNYIIICIRNKFKLHFIIHEMKSRVYRKICTLTKKFMWLKAREKKKS